MGKGNDGSTAFSRSSPRIYDLVRAIPRGKVMTYGQIALLVAEVSRGPVPAIQVGRAMAASGHFAPDIPWWRVIGRGQGYGVLRNLRLSKLQRDLLAEEGIIADAEGRYDLAACLYQP
jgi:methylated-DNA-protein-cysteine methyltransferase-like protein